MFLYGKVPSGPLVIFCNLVLALSSGKLATEALIPEIALAAALNVKLSPC
jgi:hypothetical protein